MYVCRNRTRFIRVQMGGGTADALDELLAKYGFTKSEAIRFALVSLFKKSPRIFPLSHLIGQMSEAGRSFNDSVRQINRVARRLSTSLPMDEEFFSSIIEELNSASQFAHAAEKIVSAIAGEWFEAEQNVRIVFDVDYNVRKPMAVSLRVNKVELEQINKFCCQYRLSVSQLVRIACLSESTQYDGKIALVHKSDMDQFSRELTRWLVNERQSQKANKLIFSELPYKQYLSQENVAQLRDKTRFVESSIQQAFLEGHALFYEFGKLFPQLQEH